MFVNHALGNLSGANKMKLFRRDGKSLKFNIIDIDDDEYVALMEMILYHGGEVTDDEETIVKFTSENGHGLKSYPRAKIYDVKFIVECVRQSRIVDPEQFRLGEKNPEDEYCMLHFLYGDCSSNRRQILPKEKTDGSVITVYDSDDCATILSQNTEEFLSAQSTNIGINASQIMDTEETLFHAAIKTDPHCSIALQPDESYPVISNVQMDRYASLLAGGDVTESLNDNEEKRPCNSEYEVELKPKIEQLAKEVREIAAARETLSVVDNRQQPRSPRSRSKRGCMTNGITLPFLDDPEISIGSDNTENRPNPPEERVMTEARSINVSRPIPEILITPPPVQSTTGKYAVKHENRSEDSKAVVRPEHANNTIASKVLNVMYGKSQNKKLLSSSTEASGAAEIKKRTLGSNNDNVEIDLAIPESGITLWDEYPSYYKCKDKGEKKELVREKFDVNPLEKRNRRREICSSNSSDDEVPRHAQSDVANLQRRRHKVATETGPLGSDSTKNRQNSSERCLRENTSPSREMDLGCLQQQVREDVPNSSKTDKLRFLRVIPEARSINSSRAVTKPSIASGPVKANNSNNISWIPTKKDSRTKQNTEREKGVQDSTDAVVRSVNTNNTTGPKVLNLMHAKSQNKTSLATNTEEFTAAELKKRTWGLTDEEVEVDLPKPGSGQPPRPKYQPDKRREPEPEKFNKHFSRKRHRRRESFSSSSSDEEVPRHANFQKCRGDISPEAGSSGIGNTRKRNANDKKRSSKDAHRKEVIDLDSSEYNFSSDTDDADGEEIAERTVVAPKVENNLPKGASRGQKWRAGLISAKAKNARAGKFRKHYTPMERRRMVKYLVMRRSVHLARGLVIWKEMIDDGLMDYRTPQSLHNHFVKKILPSVETIDFLTESEKAEFLIIKEEKCQNIVELARKRQRNA